MIVVTGGAGFIGSRLVEKLVALGYDAVVWDIAQPRLNGSSQYLHLDVRSQKDVLEAMPKADVVFHLAGPVVADVRRAAYESWVLQHTGTLNVLEACRVHRVSKLVFASSFYVYEGIDAGSIVSEDTTLDLFATGFFGVAKLMAERLIREYAVAHRLGYSILRLGSAFGSGRCTNSIKALLEAGFSHRPFEIWGDGQRKIQYTFVDDLAAGLVLAAEGGNGTYNLASPEAVSARSLARMVEELYGFEVFFNLAMPPGPTFPVISSERAMRELGWIPSGFASALRTVAEEVRVAMEGQDSVVAIAGQGHEAPSPARSTTAGSET